MIDRLLDTLEAALPWALGLCVVLGIAAAGFYAVSITGPDRCAASWPDRKTAYSLSTGCLVRQAGEFVPADQVLVVSW